MYRHRTTYGIGNTVFLKTDPEQLPRIVITIRITPTGVLYQCVYGITSSDHYEIELTPEPVKTAVMGFAKPVI